MSIDYKISRADIDLKYLI